MSVFRVFNHKIYHTLPYPGQGMVEIFEIRGIWNFIFIESFYFYRFS